MTSSPPALHCPTCGYYLTGLPENRCPECGDEFDPTHLRTTILKRLCLTGLLIVTLHLGGFALFTTVLMLFIELLDLPRFGWWEVVFFGLLLFVAASNSWSISRRIDQLPAPVGLPPGAPTEWKRMLAMMLVLMLPHYFAAGLGAFIFFVISIEAGWITAL